jgi:formylglycine-generating enzyme required for sulfatase activity
MKNNLLLVIFLVFLVLSCGGKKTDVLLIVKEEGVGVMGTVTFERTPSGKFQPKLWVPGYIVIFRIDGKFGDEPGKAGQAYEITKDYKLDPIGKVNLNKSDEDLAEQFGIKMKKSLPEAKIDKDVPEMVFIPSGECLIGSSDEDVDWVIMKTGVKAWGGGVKGELRKKVNIKAFYISKYEITNKEFKKFIDATGYRLPLLEGTSVPYSWENGSYPEGLENHPVVLVSQNDARKYCEWLSKRTGKHYRLPTEAEWEKAASWDETNKTKLRYPWGNDYVRERYDWIIKNIGAGPLTRSGFSKVYTMPVGSFEFDKSPYGIYDMGENVAEWVAEARRLKGGSFIDISLDDTTAKYTILNSRSANKWSYPEDDEGKHIWRGFRIARDR